MAKAAAAAAPAAAPGEEAPAKSKKPIILILVGVIALVVIVAGTMVGTLFITGFFNKPPPSADQLLAEDGHGADAHGAKPADAPAAKPADGKDAKAAKPADGKDAKGAKPADGKDVSGPPKLNKKITRQPTLRIHLPPAQEGLSVQPDELQKGDVHTDLDHDPLRRPGFRERRPRSSAALCCVGRVAPNHGCRLAQA